MTGGFVTGALESGNNTVHTGSHRNAMSRSSYNRSFQYTGWSQLHHDIHLVVDAVE